MQVLIKENRGRKRKYNFDQFTEVGIKATYNAIPLSSLLTCAKSYCKLRKLKWKFRCYRDEDGKSVIVRVK